MAVRSKSPIAGRIEENTLSNIGRFMQSASIVDPITAPIQSAAATSFITLEFEAATDVEATC
jgi:hypothetical protein